MQKPIHPNVTMPALGWFFAVCMIMFLGGCSTVSPTTQKTAIKLKTQRASILTGADLSQSTVNTLAKVSKTQAQCLVNLSDCVKKLAEAPQLGQPNLHSSLAELYLATALSLKDSCKLPTEHSTALTDKSQNPEGSHGLNSQPDKQKGAEYRQKVYAACIQSYELALAQSIRFSYAYLFFGEQSLQSRAFSDQQVQVRDYYNQAVNDLTSSVYNRLKHAQPKTTHFTIKDIKFDIIIKQSPSTSEPNISQLSDLISAYNLAFSGLATQSTRDGFGVSHVAVFGENLDINPVGVATIKQALSNTKTDAQNVSESDDGTSIAERIFETSYLPRTIVVTPRGKSLKEVLTTKNFNIQVFNPSAETHMHIQGQTYPLAANFSAPYGLWLSQNNYQSTGYINFFAGLESLSKPRLYMLEPYNPNKRVIIMLHGLASSPESWINLTNDLASDPVLRNNFQVWQVFYATNIPIVENRLEIYNLIKATYDKYDPSGNHRASAHSVLIGHSMGGILGRMLLSNSDMSSKVLAELEPNNQNKLKSSTGFYARFQLHALPQVDRAVFLSAPFRGTPFADRWFTTALRRVARLPSAFLGEVNNTLAKLSGDNTQLAGFKSLFLDNAASQLSNTSSFMRLTKDIRIDPAVTYHLIIGKNDDKPLEQSSDGVVPYTSAHLDGAVSEKVIKSWHSTQQTPEAVLELRRILRQHLYDIDGIAPPAGNLNRAIFKTTAQLDSAANAANQTAAQ